MTGQSLKNGYFSRQSRLYLQIRKIFHSYPEWRFDPPSVQIRRELERFGSEHAGYYLDPTHIDQNSIVYSLGVGEDISFDLALIKRFGVHVHAFDPTPRVREWLGSQSVPERFHFHDVGIADFDGEVDFLETRGMRISYVCPRFQVFTLVRDFPGFSPSMDKD